MSGTTTLEGGAGDEVLGSTLNGSQWIDGKGGNDTIWGSTQTDTLIGGAGRDLLTADQQSDLLIGGTYEVVDGVAVYGDDLESDTLLGGNSSDTLYGGKDDWLVAGNGDDTAVIPNGYSWNGTDTVSTAMPGGGTYTFQIYSNGSDTIALSGFDVVNNTAFDGQPCFFEGTLIATARGEVRVEDLRAADLSSLAEAMRGTRR